VIILKIDPLLKPDAQAPGAESPMLRQSRSDRCAKMKDLGFTRSRHINMYGKRFEIVSEPFSEGDCVAVRATCGNDPEIRTLRLPTGILVASADRFVKEQV
jgi:hypothetical protein